MSPAAVLNPARRQAETVDRKSDITVVVPVRNEAENIPELIRQLKRVLVQEQRLYEVIIVNDGSDDATAAQLQVHIAGDPRFTVIEFMRSFGQSAAMAAGFRYARGRVIVPMDGDLQNDPADIPGLVAALDEGPGWDVVTGWRKNRQDKWLSRKLPSLIANRIIRKLTWCDDIHDFGCTLKAFRREALEGVRLYGEMHRFLPYICRRQGARITERVVNHRPRIAGETKYGLKRTFKVLLDLLTAKFLGDYSQKPMYFFGKLGAMSLMTSFAAVALAIVQKFGYLTEFGEPVRLNNNIFILFAMMMFITSVVLLMMGVVSELLIRIYHESQDRPPYRIRKVHGGPPAGAGSAHAPSPAND